MIGRHLYIALVLMLMFSINQIYASVPLNLSSAKRDLIHYYESGEYGKDVAKIMNEAEVYLEKRVDENQRLPQPQKLAIVFDIDDTCINNFPNYRKKDFGHTNEVINDGFHDVHAPAIIPVLNFYKKAISKGVYIFLISLRPYAVLSYTITNLQNAGFYGYSDIFLPKSNEEMQSGPVYKANIRKMLTEQGYNIIENIGDQETDFLGGYQEQYFKLPNSMYSLIVEHLP